MTDTARKSSDKVNTRRTTVDSKRFSKASALGPRGTDASTRSKRLSSAVPPIVFGTITAFRKIGSTDGYDRTKVPKFQNTYWLESKNPYNLERVDYILKEVLTKELDNVYYDPHQTPVLVKQISAEIRARIKLQQFERYKIICMVLITEKKFQDLYMASKFLWDAERDKYNVYQYENISIFATAIVFGVYYD